ncbi:two-component sensor histidine kinase [Siphonobacter sp. SORGH_AS_0500]|uniref:sensor histidine kinase n=1 Tax=Siphonobacter sp. SORGH_AS_0500 TaxID=1864824 RepID=UPI000CC82B70|nr:HAMP domain-containing sensor histidine kinase [Siphonobacter sp. SORGH_AS_0500]PKK37484.1 two-component sensor histidine kinase [Siphonobacter sp. SORGH_AS_0500]
MRLLEKTNRIYLFFSLSLYVIAAFSMYGIIKWLIYDEVESRLLVEKRDFLVYIHHYNWKQDSYFVENKIEVEPAHEPTDFKETFKDTLIQDRYSQKMIPFRQLTFYVPIQRVEHRVTIRKSMIQSYRLIEAITFTMALMLGLLLLGTYWFQNQLSGRIWQPFYDTLSRIKHFDLTQKQKLQLAQPEIIEFNELNEVLQKMSDKILHDYLNLKEFTENASHELQTPLALINAKVEQLIQAEQLTENQTHWIQTIYEASLRMSRLNQGLLLLAKIENRQFVNQQTIDLSEELTEKLADMEEMVQYKKIQLSVTIESPFMVVLPPVLAESLITNLVSNALRHNVAGGEIRLHSSSDRLCLSNTGHVLLHAPNELFSRFKKEGSSSESLGLGLAIVKEICDNYGLQIQYTEVNGLHTFCLSLKS